MSTARPSRNQIVLVLVPSCSKVWYGLAPGTDPVTMPRNPRRKPRRRLQRFHSRTSTSAKESSRNWPLPAHDSSEIAGGLETQRRLRGSLCYYRSAGFGSVWAPDRLADKVADGNAFIEVQSSV